MPFRRTMAGWLIFTLILCLVVSLTAGWYLLQRPSAERDWAVDQAVLPEIVIQGGRVTVRNERDFIHRAGRDPEPRYKTEAFQIGDVQGVWLVLAPFAERWRGLAHAFLSFERRGDRFLAVSVEARRERGESYSLLGGLLRRLEVVYVIGSESDLIGLRALRGDTLYLYPTRATPDQSQTLLRDMLQRAEKLRAEPEFYNTITNNCATNIRDAVNRILSESLPYGWGMLLPGYSDEMAMKHGLLDTDLPIDEARSHFRVDAKARRAMAEGVDDGTFSLRIRP